MSTTSKELSVDYNNNRVGLRAEEKSVSKISKPGNNELRAMHETDTKQAFPSASLSTTVHPSQGLFDSSKP